MSQERSIPLLMKVQVDDRPWVRVKTFHQEEYCEHGLRPLGAEAISVPWSKIKRVALGYEIHSIAIEDWDFWAFQTDDPLVTYWVYVDWNSPFSLEVRRRFDVGNVPPMSQWVDQAFNIRAYVVWPAPDFGEPMYVTVKRRWWSWRGALAYSKTSFSANGAD